MTQPESRLSSKIQRELRAKGAFVFKIHGSEYMTAGLPDLVGCYRGAFFGFEVKMPEKRDNVSKRQIFIRERIARAEGMTAVVCSPEEALQVLREFDERRSLLEG